MLISIEFDRTCDLPGMRVRTPTLPPPLWIRTCMTFKDLGIKSKGDESTAREELREHLKVHFSHFKATGKPIFSRTKRIENEICVLRPQR